jgi:cation transport ATPase
MLASGNGHHDIVRTLLEAKADLNAKNNVRNQLMMIIIIILLTILMMMIMMIVIDVFMLNNLNCCCYHNLCRLYFIFVVFINNTSIISSSHHFLYIQSIDCYFLWVIYHSYMRIFSIISTIWYIDHHLYNYHWYLSTWRYITIIINISNICDISHTFYFAWWWWLWV